MRYLRDSTMDDSWGMAFGGAVKEEIVLSKVDTAVGHEIQVKLLTYPDGSMDLFRAQGNQFRDHLAEAKALLRERGLLTGEVELMLPTGAYLPVWEKQEAKVDAEGASGEDHRRLSLAPFSGLNALLELTEPPARAELAAGMRMVG